MPDIGGLQTPSPPPLSGNPLPSERHIEGILQSIDGDSVVLRVFSGAEEVYTIRENVAELASSLEINQGDKVIVILDDDGLVYTIEKVVVG